MPQGSVCGPILYNIYVNDMSECVKDCKIVMYADDARLYIAGNCIDANVKLALELEKITQWATVWQLKLNVKKCGVMHIGYNNPKYDYVLNTEILHTMLILDDLGLVVDNKLHFSDYIGKIVGKAYRMCSTILNGFYTNRMEFLMALYKTYVRPILEYNTVIWAPSCMKYIDKCERVQRFFTKRLHGLWDVPYLKRLEILKLESLEERRLYNDVTCVYKLFLWSV